MFKKITEDLFAWKLIKQRVALIVNEPYSTKIIDALVKGCGEIITTDLMDKSDHGESENFNDAIQHLVDVGLLRYTRNGTVRWHGRPQQCEFKGYHKE